MNIHARKALVIDDEGIVSILIEDILSDRGFSVTVCNTRGQLEEAVQQGGWASAVSDTDGTYDEMATWNVDRIIICSGRTNDDLAANYPGLTVVTKPSAADFDRVLGERHD